MDVNSYKPKHLQPDNLSGGDPLSVDRISVLTDELKRISHRMRGAYLNRDARSCLREIESLVVELQADLLSRDLVSVSKLFDISDVLPRINSIHWVIPNQSYLDTQLISKEVSVDLEKFWKKLISFLVKIVKTKGSGGIGLSAVCELGAVKIKIVLSQKKGLKSEDLLELQKLSSELKKYQAWMSVEENKITLTFPIHFGISRFTVFTFEGSEHRVAILSHALSEDEGKFILHSGIDSEKLKIKENLGTYWCFRRNENSEDYIYPGNLGKTQIYFLPENEVGKSE